LSSKVIDIRSSSSQRRVAKHRTQAAEELQRHRTVPPALVARCHTSAANRLDSRPVATAVPVARAAYCW